MSNKINYLNNIDKQTKENDLSENSPHAVEDCSSNYPLLLFWNQKTAAQYRDDKQFETTNGLRIPWNDTWPSLRNTKVMQACPQLVSVCSARGHPAKETSGGIIDKSRPSEQVVVTISGRISSSSKQRPYGHGGSVTARRVVPHFFFLSRYKMWYVQGKFEFRDVGRIFGYWEYQHVYLLFVRKIDEFLT